MASKKPKWIKITPATMPPGGRYVLFGARVYGVWRYIIAMLVPDTPFEGLTKDGISYWAELPDWITKGP